MIVCLCRGVPEQAIQRVIASGARTVDDVSRACGAGTDCGACYRALAEMVREASDASYATADRA
jgi:bacterioferritin-associated ferredoxin